MNTKITFLIRLFLLALFFTFSSCEKDLQEEAIQEKVKINSETKIEGNVNYVTIDEVPFLKTSIKSFQAKNKLTAKGVTPALELDHIAEYEGSDGYVSYSIAIEQPPGESNDYYFENLNIIKSGDQYETFIIRYNLDDDSQYLDFSNFTGTTVFFTNDYQPVSTVTFQASSARKVDVAPSPPVENIGSGGGCNCGPSLVVKLFNWIKDAIDNVGYAISNISITAYSNAGNNGYNYNPYVIVVTPPDMGTNNNPNYPDPSGGSSTIIVSPNEPEWTPTDSQSIMAKRLCRRIDFNDLSVRDWLLDPNNVESVKGFYFVLWEENSLENQLFVKQAVESVSMGAEVDLAYRVIDKLTGKTKCIYERLKNTSSGFENAIKKFDGEFPVSHLKLTINNNLAANVYGETQPPVNYVTEIRFNEISFGLLSDLGKATVFAHEIIHAEIFRKMLSAAQRGTLNSKSIQEQIFLVNSLKNNFPGLYDYYEKRWKPTWNHEMMANHYRKTIADIIQEFDNNRLPRSTYEAVAWLGLGKLDTNLTTIAWDNVPAQEKAVINTLIQENFYSGPSTCN